MLVVDALPVEDFTGDGWPQLRQLVAGGGMIGLMNTRTGGSAAAPASHVSLGAGARGRAGALSGLAFDAGGLFRELTAAELYAGLTGQDPGNDAVLFLGLAELGARNADLPDRVVPGALGEAVRSAGGQTAAIGNADLHDAFRRHGVLLAMDARGAVGLGAVGWDTLMDDPDWPFAWRTDYDAVWEAFLAAAEDANLIVIELGDLARLDAYADWVPPARLRELRRLAIQRMDDFIGRLARWATERQAAAAREGAPAHRIHLLLVTPTPPAAALRSNFLLAPLVWAPLGGPPGQGQLATSPTTRRAGIVANTDVAPTVLAALGVAAPAPMTGRPLSGTSVAALTRDLPATVAAPGDPWEAVALLYRRATAVHRLRPPVVRTFIGLAIAVFVAWAAWLALAALTKTPGPESRLAFWRWALLLLLAAPLSILLLPLLMPGIQSLAAPLAAPPPAAAAGAPPVGPLETPAAVILLLGGLALVLAALASAAGRPGSADPFAALSLATVAALLVDVSLGAPLIKSSILGYDPITGARFYGIGNEYMGVLIGTALVGTTGLLDRFPRPGLRWLALLVYGLVAVVLAHPRLGVNVGGTVAAVSGFAVTGLLLWRRRLSWRTALFAGAALVLVLAAAAVVDLSAQAQPSHLGQAARLVAGGDWEALGNIAARKLQMNVRLLRWTIWAQVLVVSLAITAVALYRPGELIRRLEQGHPDLVRGVRGAVVASLVALVANDSGVVAAATAMIPVTATLLYLVLLDRGFRR
ncbi:MAG TPA: hypothetical protein VIK93_09430 [Limnochordales bacterium]